MTEREEFAELAQTLDPAAFTRRIYQDIRGSLPSSSIPNGSRSADKPMPRLDREDVRLLQLLGAYQTAYSTAILAATNGHTRQALTHLRRCQTLETVILPERYQTPEQLAERHRQLQREAEEEQSPNGLPCNNPDCHHLILGGHNDERQRGLCRKCYRFLMKHGYHRTPELCAQDLDYPRSKDGVEVDSAQAG